MPRKTVQPISKRQRKSSRSAIAERREQKRADKEFEAIEHQKYLKGLSGHRGRAGR